MKLTDSFRVFMWLLLGGSIVLTLFGDRLIAPGWSGRGLVALGAYFALSAVAIAASKPARCPRGHTDIGFYYGRWSCRTCYGNARRRNRRPRMQR